MGTNHFGHFLLTAKVFEVVRSTPGARIVNVSSNAHKWGRMDFENLLFEGGRDYVHQVGKLAQRLNAKTCSVVSAIGANAGSSNYYNQTKGEAEMLLQGVGLNSLRIFRPSMLHGSRDEFRLKEAVGNVVLTMMTPFLHGPWKKFRTIRVEQVAKAMYESARQDYPALQIFESDEIQRL